MSEGGSFETTVDLNAPVQEVFRHLTDPVAMVRWMGQHATLEPAPGGAFEVDINGVPVRGRYLEVDPPRRVVVSWGLAGSDGLPPGATRVLRVLRVLRAEGVLALPAFLPAPLDLAGQPRVVPERWCVLSHGFSRWFAGNEKAPHA